MLAFRDWRSFGDAVAMGDYALTGLLLLVIVLAVGVAALLGGKPGLGRRPRAVRTESPPTALRSYSFDALAARNVVLLSKPIRKDSMLGSSGAGRNYRRTGVSDLCESPGLVSFRDRALRRGRRASSLS